MYNPTGRPTLLWSHGPLLCAPCQM
uniref:Uncharacterized protein n=1 Tax=Anguilla anguilla TaxID=7936 RepID=A0A0E9T1C6_ANGAN